MARITRPLTFTEIKQAKPKDKEYALSDGQGLMLSIRPSGSKVWIYKYYKPFTKKRTNLSFGAFPEISITDARKLRMEAQSLLAKNLDPKEERDKHHLAVKGELANTFESVAKSWFEVKKHRITEGYAEDIWRSFELHLFPSLAKQPITRLQATTVIATLKPIEAKGSLETVKRLCQRINEVMDYAVNTGIITANSLAKINAAFQKPKKRICRQLNQVNFLTL